MDYGIAMDRELLAKCIEYMSTTNGRDKMCRTVQYLSKFLSTYYGTKDPGHKRLKDLATALSMARKAFRMFKSLEMYEALLKLDDEKDIVLRSTTGLKAVGYGIYLLYDNWIFLAKSGAIVDSQVQAKILLAYKFWLLGIAASIVRQLYQLYGLYVKRLSPGQDAAALAKNDAALRKTGISLAKDLCDLMLPMQQLGWGGVLCPSERLASFGGFVSSLIGAVQLWK